MESKILAFEIKDWTNQKHYKIYLDGEVEGFDNPVGICNWIPTLIQKAIYCQSRDRISSPTASIVPTSASGGLSQGSGE